MNINFAFFDSLKLNDLFSMIVSQGYYYDLPQPMTRKYNFIVP